MRTSSQTMPRLSYFGVEILCGNSVFPNMSAGVFPSPRSSVNLSRFGPEKSWPKGAIIWAEGKLLTSSSLVVSSTTC